MRQFKRKKKASFIQYDDREGQSQEIKSWRLPSGKKLLCSPMLGSIEIINPQGKRESVSKFRRDRHDEDCYKITLNLKYIRGLDHFLPRYIRNNNKVDGRVKHNFDQRVFYKYFDNSLSRVSQFRVRVVTNTIWLHDETGNVVTNYVFEYMEGALSRVLVDKKIADIEESKILYNKESEILDLLERQVVIPNELIKVDIRPFMKKINTELLRLPEEMQVVEEEFLEGEIDEILYDNLDDKGLLEEILDEIDNIDGVPIEESPLKK